MALFRLPLSVNKKISFWRLMGSGGKDGFAIQPDWRQWAVLLVFANEKKHPDMVENPLDMLPSFLRKWLSFFHCKSITYLLKPIEGHGLWNGKEVFGQLPRQTAYEGEIAVLTRASIRAGKVSSFRKHVHGVAAQMAIAEGFVQSYGIGEIPLLRQATFSIWKSKEAMKQFAYGLQQHKTVIRKTHEEKWYSEEMFVRFRIVKIIES
jgi:hypothetical protein